MLTLWDRGLRRRGTARRRRSSDYGAVQAQGGETTRVPDVGMQDKARFVAGVSEVNLRRELKCRCFAGTSGKLEEVWKEEAETQKVNETAHRSLKHQSAKFNQSGEK